MQKGVAFITNPCGHAFHVACQATAVAARLTSCGLCRAPLTLTVFPAAPPPAAGVDDEDDDEDDGEGDDAEVDDDGDIEGGAGGAGGAGGGAGGAGGAGGGAGGFDDDDEDDDVVCVADYTAGEADAARRAAEEVVDLTAEELQAHAREVHKKHGDALTLALVADREAALVKAMHDNVFAASDRRKDGKLKASITRKTKRVARDGAAYGAGKKDAKKMKMGDSLEG
jgi:hypothetical protein